VLELIERLDLTIHEQATERFIDLTPKINNLSVDSITASTVCTEEQFEKLLKQIGDVFFVSMSDTQAYVFTKI
jgi:hypothetical protein